MDDAALELQFSAELAALTDSGAGLPFVFTPPEAFMLLSLLQLALRHPGIKEFPAVGVFGKSLAENIQGRLCKTSAMQEVARRGWDAKHDVTASS